MYNVPMSNERRKARGSSIKSGILLMAIGLLAGAIPNFGSILTILILVGAIIVFVSSRDLSVQYRKITTVALVLILVMIILEIYGVSKMLYLLFGLSGATSLSYSTLVRATDPFIFMESIAYVLLSAALLLVAYPILSGSFRKALWIVYPVAYLIFLAESFTQMTALNSMYYQAVTMNNIGVYTSVSDGLDIGASLFMLIWAIMFFITYSSARKIFPKFAPPYGLPYQGIPQPYSQPPANLSSGGQTSSGQITCPNCGTLNTADSKFCARCGTKLQ